MLAFGCDVEGVEFALGSFDGSDDLSIEFLPIRYLSIRTCSQNLIFFSIEDRLLEGCSFEHAQQTGVFLEIPNDA